MERQREGDVEFLGIAWHDTREAMQAFVDTYGIRMPTAIDETDQIFASFGFSYQPAWAFVDDDGTVETFFGALDEASLQAEIDALVAS